MGLINLPYRQKVFKPIGMPQIDWDDPLARGLAGYWGMFPYEAGGKTVFDLSGNGNDGTFVNTPVWVPGQYGSAIDFVSGDTDYINLSDFTLAGETQITIIASIKGVWGATDLHTICGKYGTSLNRQFYLAVFQKDVRLFIQEDNSNKFSEQGDTNLSDNVQYQIAGVWRGGTDAEVYINGIKDDSTAVDISGLPSVLQTTSENMLIAARDDGASGLTTAIIDWIIIYNRALSASEIAKLYQEPFRLIIAPRERALFVNKVGVVVGANPKGPLTHPLYGALAGPISF